MKRLGALVAVAVLTLACRSTNTRPATVCVEHGYLAFMGLGPEYTALALSCTQWATPTPETR